jgi:hypothetical protein
MRSVCRWGTPETELNVASTLSRFHRWTKRLLAAGPARKRTEITTETDRILIIRRRSVIRAWCQECACEVDMVSLEDPGAITGTLPFPPRSGPESQAWHFCEGPDGEKLVCLESLLKSL